MTPGFFAEMIGAALAVALVSVLVRWGLTKFFDATPREFSLWALGVSIVLCIILARLGTGEWQRPLTLYPIAGALVFLLLFFGRSSWSRK